MIMHLLACSPCMLPQQQSNLIAEPHVRTDNIIMERARTRPNAADACMQCHVSKQDLLAFAVSDLGM